MFKGIDQIFRDEMLLRNEQEVQLEIYFKSPIQHCLFKARTTLVACQRVISMNIEHLSKKSTLMHQQTLEQAVPDLLFHTMLKKDKQQRIVPETVFFFGDQVQRDGTKKEGASFFVELEGKNYPQFFNSPFKTILIGKDSCKRYPNKKQDEQAID